MFDNLGDAVMKLSMWMIANRLTSLDLETEIKEDAPVILKSARRAYATNCVHVYREKDYVVCNGEGNIIRIRNIEVTQAVEIMQSVFDFYEDWLERLLSLVREKNYQEVVDQTWMVFHNPMILFDGNNKVLGISGQYTADSLDEEWGYLCKYGYSSLNAIQHMRYKYGNVNFDQPGCQPYQFMEGNLLSYSGISFCLYCDEVICGRINLIAADRELNAGDHQLLEKLGTILEPSLGQQYYETFLRNSNVFYSILFGKAYDEEKLDQQLSYQQWELDDTYQLALVHVVEVDTGKSLESQMDILLHTILQQQPSCVVLRKAPYILILSNKIIAKDQIMLHFMEVMAKNNSLQFGFSLPCHGLQQASYLFEQCKAALNYGRRNEPHQCFYYFFDHAIEYIIETTPLVRCTYACHPRVYDLWSLKESNRDEMYDTLKVYLDNERSIARTAAELFTHRNTIVYRMNKIRDFLVDDLNDAYVRDYVRLSMRVLELYGRK